MSKTFYLAYGSNLNLEQMAYLINSAPYLRCVFLYDKAVCLGQAQGTHSNPLVFRAADQAFDQGYLQLSQNSPS